MQYQRIVSVKALPHIYIGATICPFLLWAGVEDLTDYSFWAGLFFVGTTLFTLFDGYRALKHKVISDFIMLFVVPIALPVALVVYYWLS
ncbi:hypothetical protein [Thalassotalea agarivorans]|uniref:Uncharacterized protein n=1 Tax=Thalassotalea agarivorans TaxID=349064 RepID=A0A1I0CQW6_THASX|nr:hypothetical protein [Thalassotalea agarivorans]SET22169.1 hypothetical protein SAMN05660429_01298 [Thalassotalea agarivorans]